MFFSDKFICATEEYSSYERFIPAPYFRKEFDLTADIVNAEITICGLGFYRLWINGKEITKGIIAPYVSNPDDIKYYDNYSITDLVSKGKNVISILLGNGMLNNPGGEIWDFEKASFRRSPCVSFCVEGLKSDGKSIFFESDESVLCADSPLYFDDYRSGERYNAENEIEGWNEIFFDASGWEKAKFTVPPKGIKRLCEADPVKPTGEILKAVSIKKGHIADDYRIHNKMTHIKPYEISGMKSGFIYDFGKNKSGVPLLRIKGEKGQRIELQFGEFLDQNGDLSYRNINFYPDEYSQRDVFICSGKDDVFMPCFTYHGARYCIVTGINESQATTELLSFVVCNSDIRETASFNCSDETINRLYDMCKTSDLANFYYFPTDCPHREKNGWTGDIALSCEHMLMMYNCEKSLSEWMVNVRESQLKDGQLCAIIPTTGWGFGTGPSWDAFVVLVPYYTYIYKNDIKILEDNSDCIFNYILWAQSTRNEKGLIKHGLGDWCPVGGNDNIKASPQFTGNVSFLDALKKSSFIFDIIGNKERKEYVDKLYKEIRCAIRNEYVDTINCVVDTKCQTSQSLAIYYDIFNEDEKQKAFSVLLDFIHENDDFLDFGILGARIMFHLLSDFGEYDLALKIITRKEWPSYGHFIVQGLTALPESFFPDYDECDSLNHHFFGDIANFFISKIAGIRYNSDGMSPKTVIIKPCFASSLSFASASLETPFGKVSVNWQRDGKGIHIVTDSDSSLNVLVMHKDLIIGEGSGEFII